LPEGPVAATELRHGLVVVSAGSPEGACAIRGVRSTRGGCVVGYGWRLTEDGRTLGG